MLPGGETAIREVWRIALSLLDDAYEGAPPLEAFPLFRAIAPDRVAAVRRLVPSGVGAPLARGVGRYFDAFGALFLNRPESRYEGQVALEWNAAADETEAGRFPFEVETGDIATLDLRPALRAAVEAFVSGASPAAISGRFHNTVADATARLVRLCAERQGALPVVLTGGCFQNALLAERVSSELSPDFRVLLHGEVPPGDGGLAIGQALVAAALARRRGGL